MLNLVVDIRMWSCSGIGRYIRSLYKYMLDWDNMSMTFLYLKKDEESLLKTPKHNYINFESKIYSIKEQLLYPFIVPSCDVLWIPHFNVPFFKTKAKNVVCTIHDIYFLRFIDQLNWKQKIYSRIFYRKALKASKTVFTVSEFTKDEINGVTHSKYREKLVVALNGISSDFCQVDSAVEIPIAEKSYLLYVGNVKPHKNLLRVIKAFNLAKTKGLKERLLIVGKKEGFINSVSLKGECGSDVIFTGEISDEELKCYYKGAKTFVFPSLYEGFGLPLLEAMSFGIPVIASNAASIPEVGGKCVKYFDPYSIEDIANSMLNPMDASEMYSDQLKKFSWQSCAKIIKNEIQKHG